MKIDLFPLPFTDILPKVVGKEGGHWGCAFPGLYRWSTLQVCSYTGRQCRKRLMPFAYEWIPSGICWELLLACAKIANTNLVIYMEMAVRRELLLLDCALYTRCHVMQTHRYSSLLATNCGLELQHKLKNASGSYGCEGNTERGWGGEPCEDKDKITPLTSVSFYQANLKHSPDNEEGQISIWATNIGCTLELLPRSSVHSAACSCPSSFLW